MNVEAGTSRSPVVAWREDLRLRIMVIALAPLILAVTLLAGYFMHRQIDAAWSGLAERGETETRRLAEAAAFDLFAGNDAYLKRLLDYELASEGYLAIGIVDMNGKWGLVSGQAGQLPPPDRIRGADDWRTKGHYVFVQPIRHQRLLNDDPYLSSGKPAANALLGHVVVVLGTIRVEEARQQAVAITLTVATVLLFAAGLLAWRLSQSLSAPLNAVIATVRDIARGDLGSRVAELSGGEAGELERGINHMASEMERHGQIMQRRVEEATAELREQKQAAEAAVLARSRFLAAASHDLRQPMHALTLLVEALKERLSKGEADTVRLTENIAASAYAMQSLLNALLDLSRLDAGVVVARPECFAATPFLHRLVAQYAQAAKEKGLELRLHASDQGIYTDPMLLERILGNLLANAIRYSEQGGILIGLRFDKTDSIRIEVWDTGKGIPQGYRDRIFEEYFQLDNPERGRDKGLGLGLAIVSRLANLLGSQVEVRSTPGKGSCFRIRLARCEPTAKVEVEVEVEVAQADLASIRPSMGGQNKLVVFIDDDESILEAMTTIFEQWGIDLAAGMDAQQVKDDLIELGRPPDAILSDYRLREGRTGLEAVMALREAFGPDIPAALITGDTAPSTLQLIENSGLPVLFKPLKPASLRAMVHHMLSGDPAAVCR